MPGCFRPNATPLSAKHTPFKTVDLGKEKTHRPMPSRIKVFYAFSEFKDKNPTTCG